MRTTLPFALILCVATVAFLGFRLFTAMHEPEARFDAAQWQRLRSEALLRRSCAEVVAPCCASDKGAGEAFRYGKNLCHQY